MTLAAARPADARTLRLRLCAPSSGHTGGPGSGPVDGAWWPHSRDASRELPGLIGRLAETHGILTRVSLGMAAWDQPQPRMLAIGGHDVRLEWFRTIDPTLVTLGRGTAPRLVLRVVAPELGEADGAALLDRIAGAAA